MTLSPLQSADTSQQDQLSTTVKAQEDTTLSPLEDGDLGITSPVSPTPEQLPSAETETSTETSTLPVNGNPSKELDGGAVWTTFTPVDLDQSTGSGMSPSSSEEETTSPTSPVGPPEEAQSTAETEHLNKTVEDDRGDSGTDSKKNTKLIHQQVAAVCIRVYRCSITSFYGDSISIYRVDCINVCCYSVSPLYIQNNINRGN